MKVKKLFKIFPSAEKIKIIDIIDLDEIYFGNMSYLPSELLELPIESARSTIDLKTNRPMLNIYVMRVTDE